MRKLITICLLALGLTSCVDMFEPGKENLETFDKIYDNEGFAYGLLINGYVNLPYGRATEVATDNAVTNNQYDAYKLMAGGQWSDRNNPLENWRNGRYAIQCINLFLENVEKVEWHYKEDIQNYFEDRMSGEAYALRGLHLFTLLRAHAGIGVTSGTMLGVPFSTKSEDLNTDFNQSRKPFQECVDQIMSDFDKAIELLPFDYINNTTLPKKYTDMGYNRTDNYNRVFGSQFSGLVSGRIVTAFRSQLALMLASPLYAQYSDVDWEDAAKYSGEILETIGGPAGLDPNGATWYANIVEIDGLSSGANPDEILWRSNVGQGNTTEKDEYPPTLFGSGRTNPTQNLVDAFPMANGFPITNSNAHYDINDPYTDRDPRLAKYILINGSKQGATDGVVDTSSESATLDGLNKENGKSTRTGYYLRKHTRPDINLDPTSTTSKSNYTARIRYTEIFLNYAEAANEAYGPMTPADGLSFSAYDVIKAIRGRAGINAADPYLETIKGDKDKMREMIRNERRIELCFEGKRFYDLRRWNLPMDKINETVMGLNITASGNTKIEVETRDFKDYMYFGPIPNSEILKFSNLEQNKGW